MTEKIKLRVPVDRRTKDKVAIVGFTDHRVQAYALGDDWELWGLNELHRVPGTPMEKFARWFEVHPRKDIDTDAPHIETLNKLDIPVYMQQYHADIAPSVPFPREAIVEKFGRDYFTSSIAWEVAYAMMLGFKEIHIYGVDMANDSEYLRERNCCEYWLGRAEGMGIKTHVPITSDLLKTVGQYGFGDTGTWFSLKSMERNAWLHQQDNDWLAQIRGIDAQYPEIRAKLDAEFKARLKEIKKQKRAVQREHSAKSAAMENEYRQKRDFLLAQRNQVTGAILDNNYWNRSFAVPAAEDRTFSPDRTKDPRVGLAPAGNGRSPKDADAMGVSAERQILEGQAA